MQNISGEVLEFESLRQLMARYVPTALGQAELAKVAPHTDREQLEAALAEAEEATHYLRAVLKPQPPARGAAIRINFAPIPDLVPTVHKLRIEGAVLEPKEFLGLIEFLDHAADAKSILQSVTERFPRLGARSRGIGDFRQVLNDVAGTIQPDGTVADHASVALGRLRRDIERQRKSIQDSLERFLRAHHEEGVSISLKGVMLAPALIILGLILFFMGNDRAGQLFGSRQKPSALGVVICIVTAGTGILLYEWLKSRLRAYGYGI